MVLAAPCILANNTSAPVALGPQKALQKSRERGVGSRDSAGGHLWDILRGKLWKPVVYRTWLMVGGSHCFFFLRLQTA